MEARLAGCLAGAAGEGSAKCGFALGLVQHELLALLADGQQGTEASLARAPEWVALFRSTSEHHAPLLKHLQCAPTPPSLGRFACRVASGIFPVVEWC